MQMEDLYPVIIAGGNGTRLWPVSRESYPKQFNKIFGNESLFEKALKRNDISKHKPLVITNEQHRFLAYDQISDTSVAAKIILEPIGRDSFAACLVAALEAYKENSEAIVLIAPADHLIADKEYHETIKTAYELAKTGKLVTLGIDPTFPHIGYGYIEQGQLLKSFADSYLVKKFHEKPDYTKAESYLNSGNHLWNAGIFIFPVKEFIAEAKKFHPDLVALVEASLKNAIDDDLFTFLDQQYFAQIEKISVDYALLEKSQNITVVKSKFAWNDVGSWDSYMEVLNTDKERNIIEAKAKNIDSENILIKSDNDKLIVTIGLENLIIINTDDALLISAKDQSDQLKKLVSELKNNNCEQVKTHAKQRRPWGYFQIINEGKRYKAKKLVIHPQQKISLQYHHKRSEHWVIVEGTAKVTLGDKEVIYSENESVYIPKTVKHRVENIGEIDLKIIEVQTGSYLGEDDIVRISDSYKRS